MAIKCLECVAVCIYREVLFVGIVDFIVHIVGVVAVIYWCVFGAGVLYAAKVASVSVVFEFWASW